MGGIELGGMRASFHIETGYPFEHGFNICFRIKNHEMISNWPTHVDAATTRITCHSNFCGYLIIFIEYAIIQFIVLPLPLLLLPLRSRWPAGWPNGQ